MIQNTELIDGIDTFYYDGLDGEDYYIEAMRVFDLNYNYETAKANYLARFRNLDPDDQEFLDRYNSRK
jgi:hypothetical protein